MSTITAQIQLRRDTSANWTSNNPILLAGEMALSTDVLYTGTDQPRYKIGNGVDTWLNLDYVPEGGTSSYPENLFLTVVNKTGDNLLATGYKVVKVSDAQGQRLAVDYALADSNGNSVDTIGIVYENINNNQVGKLIVIGQLSDLNTTGSLQNETWNDGDVLYLSSSTPGNLTKVQPIAPNHLVVIGYVVHAHVTQGKIYCKVQNGWELGELHDVYAPTPTHNDGIFWSSGTTRYENKSITTVLGYTPSQGYTLLFTAGVASLISPADATTYYFGSGRTSIYSPDHAVIIPKAGTLKSISFFHVVNSTLGTAENSTLSVQVRNTGYSGAVSTTTQITNTYKFNTIYNSTMFTGLNIDLPEGCAVDIKWLTPTWVTNPAQIQINATLFIV